MESVFDGVVVFLYCWLYVLVEFVSNIYINICVCIFNFFYWLFWYLVYIEIY